MPRVHVVSPKRGWVGICALLAGFVVGLAECILFVWGAKSSTDPIALVILSPLAAGVLACGLPFLDQRRNRFAGNCALLALGMTLVPAVVGGAAAEDWSRYAWFLAMFFAVLWVGAVVLGSVGLAISHVLFCQVLQDGETCPGCGYCLRGLESQLCPECGRPVTPVAHSCLARRSNRFGQGRGSRPAERRLRIAGRSELAGVLSADIVEKRFLALRPADRRPASEALRSFQRSWSCHDSQSTEDGHRSGLPRHIETQATPSFEPASGGCCPPWPKKSTYAFQS